MKNVRRYAIPASIIASVLLATGALAFDIVVNTPPSSDGTYSQWDTSGFGGAHWSKVDEQLCNDGTDYVFTSTAGERDSYLVDLSGVPNGSRVNEIRVLPCAAKINPKVGMRSGFRSFYKLNGGPNVNGQTFNLTSTSFVNWASSTPFHADFVKDENTTLEIGVYVPAGLNAGGVKVSKLKGEVRYSDGN